MPNSIALRVYLIFGNNFPGMRGLILVLVPNVCYLAVIFFGGYLVVTARYLVVTARYFVVTACYWWLLLVTALYCSFPLLV